MADYKIVEISAVIVFFIGFYGLIINRNIIKSIVSIAFIEIAVVVFYLSIGFHHGATPPIGKEIAHSADPLPQALMITAIIIGVAITAVNLTMLISLCRQYKSTDWNIVKEGKLE